MSCGDAAVDAAAREWLELDRCEETRAELLALLAKAANVRPCVSRIGVKYKIINK